jgi:hypothetical protein
MKNLYNKGHGMFVRDIRLTLQNRIAEFMIAQVASGLNDGLNT